VFKTQLPYLSRIRAESKEAGDSLGQFADQQMAGSKEFLNKWLAELRDTNANKLQDYRRFDTKNDLTVAQDSNQVIPNTGKDPFYNSGLDYLGNFIQAYSNSAVVDEEDKVEPGKLTDIIRQAAQTVEKFPGSDGTRVS